MSSIRPLIPLLIAAGILLGGNGLQGTLIALRGALEGFSPATIGFMGTAYFAGFLLGCVFITPDHEVGRPCPGLFGACGHRVGRHAAAGAGHRSGDVVGDALHHRLLFRRPVHRDGKLAEFRRLEPRPRPGAGALPHYRHRLGDRRAVPHPGFRRRRLRHLRHHVDHDHAVAGAGFARRPLQSAAARRRQARSAARLAHLAARLHRLHRRRHHQQRLPHAVARLCRADRHVGHRCRHLRQRRHHRRRHHPVSARLSLRPLGPAQGAADDHVRRDARGAGAGVLRRHRPAHQFRAGLHLRLLRHAAVFAVGRPRQRPRRQGRVRAGQCRADAVLFVRRDRRAARRGILFMQRFGPRRCSSSCADGLCGLHRDHPLPDAGAGRRAGEPARPFHRAAANLDRFSPGWRAETARSGKQRRGRD